MPQSRSPLYRQIVDSVATRIRDGEWPPGHKLPSERALCEMFGVSQITVRRALRELAHSELVTSRHGVGWYVLDSAACIPSAASVPIIVQALTPLTAACLRALGMQAASVGASLLITLDPPQTLRQDVLGSATDMPIGIMATGESQTQWPQGISDSTSVVQLVAPSVETAPPLIGLDQSQATAKTAQHLLSLGHRRIAYAGLSPQTYLGMQRYQGFAQALWDSGVEIPLDWVFAEPLASNGVLDRIVDCLAGTSAPTAIVCASDAIAGRVLSVSTRQGMRCPDDVAVVGVGDIPLSADLAPPLTTYAFDLTTWALTASAALFSPAQTQEKTHLAGGQVVVRASCGAALGGDDWLQ